MPTADNYKPAGQASSVLREGWSLSRARTPDLLHTPSVCSGPREVQDGSQRAVRQQGENEQGEGGRGGGGLREEEVLTFFWLPFFDELMANRGADGTT